MISFILNKARGHTVQDGIVLVTCNRAGCGKDLGAQRFVKGKVVEEEFYPYAVKQDDKYYCKDCIGKEDFKDPAEDMEDVSGN